MDRIIVVAAVVVMEGRLLLQQRSRLDKHYPFVWETPGGKVKEGEDDHSALYRELCEELGICNNVLITERMSVTALDPPDAPRPIEVRHYTVLLNRASSLPESTFSGEGFGWFSRDELSHLSIMPSMRPHMADWIEKLSIR